MRKVEIFVDQGMSGVGDGVVWGEAAQREVRMRLFSRGREDGHIVDWFLLECEGKTSLCRVFPSCSS